MVGGADNASMKLMVEAGKKLGVGFQIHDDILNLSGDQSKYGKEIGDDLLEGKRTLMLIRLLALCSSAEREKVKSFFKLPREQTEEGGWPGDGPDTEVRHHRLREADVLAARQRGEGDARRGQVEGRAPRRRRRWTASTPSPSSRSSATGSERQRYMRTMKTVAS